MHILRMLALYTVGLPLWRLSMSQLHRMAIDEGIVGFMRTYAMDILKVRIRRGGSFIGSPDKIIKWPIFPHGCAGIFISGDAVIGKGCVIFQQVTIGSNSLPDSKGFGAPVIGDYVYIGAGAKIIGNVHVGNHCRIGANAVVVHDVPDNSTVYLKEVCCVQRETQMDNRFYMDKEKYVDEDNEVQVAVEDGGTMPFV